MTARYLEIDIAGEPTTFDLPLHGAHNALNATAACAAMMSAGMRRGRSC